jgi:copper resistance protein C
MSTFARRPLTGLVVAIATVALIFATAAPAQAHDGLIDSSPADGSTVTTQLESVSLTFSDELLDLGSSGGAFVVQVVGPNGRFYNLDCVQRDGATASTAVALGESGTYKVLWQVVSSDGHPTSDTFEFSYDRPAEVEAAAGSPTAPCFPTGPGGSTGDKSVDTDPDAAGDSRTITGIWVAGGALVGFLLLAAIIVAVIGARSRRRSAQTGKQQLDVNEGTEAKDEASGKGQK